MGNDPWVIPALSIAFAALAGWFIWCSWHGFPGEPPIDRRVRWARKKGVQTYVDGVVFAPRAVRSAYVMEFLALACGRVDTAAFRLAPIPLGVIASPNGDYAFGVAGVCRRKYRSAATASLRTVLADAASALSEAAQAAGADDDLPPAAQLAAEL